MRTARWRQWLENDQEVSLWYENMARGSAVTAEEHIRVLYRFCEIVGLDPSDLVILAKKDLRALENELLRFVGSLEKEGKAPGYITHYLKAVKSYLQHHNITLGRKIRVKNALSTPTLEDERVPTRDELRQILSNATPRGRVIASLMAFTGIRPEVMGNMRGTDGLRVKDLPDLKIQDGECRFEKVPALVVVRASLSKANHRYFTFLPQEGCDYLKAYLDQRIAGGEPLGPESPIVRVTPGFESQLRLEKSKDGFIVSRNVSREVREAMRPKYQWRPYVLRAYFDTQLLLAESAGKMSHSYRAFFMGHKGDIEARYTTNKGRLTPAMVDDMRQTYTGATQYLETIHSAPQEDPTLRLLHMVLEARGYSKERLKELDLASKTQEEIVLMMRDPPPERGKKNSVQRQRVITMAELDSALSEGWEFKAHLPDGRAIIAQ